MMILLGIVAAVVIGTVRYTTRTLPRPNLKLTEAQAAAGRDWKFWNRPGADDILDITFWAVPFGILGARIYHVISHWQSYFGPGADWTSAFRIWEGGLAIIGGIAGGTLGAYIVCRRRKISLPVVADALAPGVLVAQGIGRWGNWFNQELYGGPTTLPWGLEIDARHLVVNPATGQRFAEGTLFHPTFLYESLWNFAFAGVLIWLDRKFKLGHGRVMALYVYFYCLGRTWVETMRTEPANVILGLRVNSWASMILGAIAIIVFCVIGYNKPSRETHAGRDVHLPLA